MEVFMAITLVVTAFLLMLIYRNKWVFELRGKMIHEAATAHNFPWYEEQLTYDQMMVRVWEWDEDRLVPTRPKIREIA